MPEAEFKFKPEIKIDNLPPVMQQYLSDHPEISRREQEFLFNYYQQLRHDLLADIASSFRSEANKLREKGLTGKEFRQTWGTKNFDQKESPNLTKIYAEAAETIKEKASRQAIEFSAMKNLAEIDHLTGLYRGPAFDKYAEETLRVSQETATQLNKGRASKDRLVSAYVAFDVDNFKTINDTIGHDRADKEILVEMGKIIRGTPQIPGLIRSTDLASRRSGDEFIIFFGHIRFDSVEPTVDRLLKSFQNVTYKKDGRIYPITVSAGVKIIEAEESITLKEAGQLADEAANLAKIEKNTFLIHSPDLPKRIEKMILDDINKPLEENRGLQFHLRQLKQLNKRNLEDVSAFNPETLEDYLQILQRQAEINLATRLKKLQRE